MELEVTLDVEQFTAAAGPFLAERMETNLMATVLASVHRGVFESQPVIFAYGSEAGRVRWAAMRTTPFPLLASSLPDGVAERLIEHWLTVDPGAERITAVTPTARALSAAWERTTGGRSELRVAEAMHELNQVREPPRPASGRLRIARPDERDLLVRWFRAFAQEARVTAAGAESAVEHRLADRHLLVWDDGIPVSLVGVHECVAGVVRVGPVYTPPSHRCRGYAGSAVAGASRRALSDGASRCMLFTDLANPTSNKIYAEVGYRRISEWEEHQLMPA
jgi:predicted GNAT family acetyltransferase